MLRWMKRRHSAPQGAGRQKELEAACEPANDFEVFVDKLGQNEIDELVKSWKHCTKDGDCFQAILLTLFRLQPQFRKYFNVPAFSCDDSIRKMEVFPKHAIRMQNFLDTIVISIENKKIAKSMLIQSCHRLGSIHFFRGVNFDEDNWTNFQYIVLQEIQTRIESSRLFSEKSQARLWNNWKRLLTLIVEQMRNGYLVETFKNFSIQLPAPPSLQPLPSDAPKRKSMSLACMDQINNNPTTLSNSEVGLIQESWNHSNKDQFGLVIMLQLLSANPGFCQCFGIESGTDSETLCNEPAIRIQAGRVTGVFDSLVHFYGILPKENLKNKCKQIGKVHFRKGVNFSTENWEMFKSVALSQVNTALPNKSPELLEACWGKLVDFLVWEIKAGFLQAAIDKKNNVSTTSI